MPINYDEIQKAEDHAFVIRGETFVIPHAHPSVMGKVREIEAKLEDATTHEAVLAIAEERLILLLDDQNGAVERWQKLREDQTSPISYGEIMDMSRRAVEMITGLPTLPASPLPSGRGTTGRSSKAE